MPVDYSLLDAATAGTIFSNMFSVVSDNFAGAAILLGGVAGLGIAAALINGARKGKLRFGVK